MRTPILLLCLMGLAFLSAIPAWAQPAPRQIQGPVVQAQAPAPAPRQIQAPAPAIQKIKITDLESYIAVSDHPLIINFWATFCEPCIKEIPYFQSTVARYNDQRVELLLVSLDLPDHYPTRIAGFAQQRAFTARILWLDETNAGYFCPKVDPRWTGGIPCSLFINNSTHYRRFFDRQLTEGQVEPEIKKMIAPAMN